MTDPGAYSTSPPGGPLTGVVRGRGRHDDDGVVGLMQQGVRHAAQRTAEAPQAAGADDDLVGLALPREVSEAFGDRTLENDAFRTGRVQRDELADELASDLVVRATHRQSLRKWLR